ncbi:MAG: HDOD domain-containing protein [Candidatus Competibacteraceae bacterium]
MWTTARSGQTGHRCPPRQSVYDHAGDPPSRSLAARIPELEQQLFNTDHCELGAALVETWRLRSFFADAIRFHHMDADDLRGAHPLVAPAPCSQYLDQTEDPQEEAFARADSLLGLNRNSLRQARFEAEREVINLAADLGIDMSTTGSRRKAAEISGEISFAQAARERMLTDGANGQLEQAGDQSALLEAMIARIAWGRQSTNMP